MGSFATKYLDQTCKYCKCRKKPEIVEVSPISVEIDDSKNRISKTTSYSASGISNDTNMTEPIDKIYELKEQTSLAVPSINEEAKVQKAASESKKDDKERKEKKDSKHRDPKSKSHHKEKSRDGKDQKHRKKDPSKKK